MVIKEAIHEVINGKDLSYEMAHGTSYERRNHYGNYSICTGHA